MLSSWHAAIAQPMDDASNETGLARSRSGCSSCRIERAPSSSSSPDRGCTLSRCAVAHRRLRMDPLMHWCRACKRAGVIRGLLAVAIAIGLPLAVATCNRPDAKWSSRRCQRLAEEVRREYAKLLQRHQRCTEAAGCVGAFAAYPGGPHGCSGLLAAHRQAQFEAEMAELNRRYAHYSAHGCPPGPTMSCASPVPVCSGGACVGVVHCTDCKKGCEGAQRTIEVPVGDERRSVYSIRREKGSSCACHCRMRLLNPAPGSSSSGASGRP